MIVWAESRCQRHLFAAEAGYVNQLRMAYVPNVGAAG